MLQDECGALFGRQRGECLDHGFAFTSHWFVEDEAAAGERDDVVRRDVLASPVVDESALGDGALLSRRDNLRASSPVLGNRRSECFGGEILSE